MIMSGLEFTGEIPFQDVYVHSVIQARDGRRMSKSLGTGIDPLEEINVHGADALRFGLLAMSSTQDVRYSDAKVQQGRDLANKMWNASRLILLNANSQQNQSHTNARQGQVPAAVGGGTGVRPSRPEDRWILSRLQRAISEVSGSLDRYDFARAALELYRFFWSELCDWYLEIVKPRLYDGEPEASATLLHVLGEVLALAHPVMPFVTEEIWSYHPAREKDLVVSGFPQADEALVDAAAEAETERGIEMTRRLRTWRDLVDVPAAAVLHARVDGEEPAEFVARLARFEFSGNGGDPVASVGSVQVLASPEIDPEAVGERLEKRREELRSEVERAERKLANEGFTRKAPEELVQEEQEKLERYRTELEELG
jgi:valyl-tRNA synthetase